MAVALCQPTKMTPKTHVFGAYERYDWFGGFHTLTFDWVPGTDLGDISHSIGRVVSPAHFGKNPFFFEPPGFRPLINGYGVGRYYFLLYLLCFIVVICYCLLQFVDALFLVFFLFLFGISFTVFCYFGVGFVVFAFIAVFNVRFCFDFCFLFLFLHSCFCVCFS